MASLAHPECLRAGHGVRTFAAVVVFAASVASCSAPSEACIGISCVNGNDGTQYCNCSLALGVGGGGECSGPDFGSGGNCCFHPDTATCRCDANPGCSRGGTVVDSCSVAMASVRVTCSNLSDSSGPYCNCALTLGGGGGSCTASQFGFQGNCCLHPDTLTCRCDANPGCSNGGTVVQSCSDALAVSTMPAMPCR